MILKAAWAANSLPAFLTESDCHSNFGDGGASGRPMQCVQHGSCAPDVPFIDSADSGSDRTGAGVSAACPWWSPVWAEWSSGAAES
jgi:hypothetical protein